MIDKDRPYPEGIAWDEAYRHRKQTYKLILGCERLEAELIHGAYISFQDGIWNLFDSDSDGINKGETLQQLIENISTGKYGGV